MSEQDKYVTLMTYGPANELYKAAVELLASMSPSSTSPELTALQEAVNSCREAIDDRARYADNAIQFARDTMTDDEYEIDDKPVVSASEGDGVWASGWMWCPWWATISLRPTQIVWTSETDIRLYFEPISSEEYDDDKVCARVEYFLGGAGSGCQR